MKFAALALFAATVAADGEEITYCTGDDGTYDEAKGDEDTCVAQSE